MVVRESSPGKAGARQFSDDAIAFNDADWPFSTACAQRTGSTVSLGAGCSVV